MRFGSRYRLGGYAAVLAIVVLGVGVTTAASAQAKPPPSHPALASELWGVSCTSASTCVAVGDEVTSAGASVMLAERWNGTAWAVQSTPTPSGAMASYLEGVSCVSASACTAIGHDVSAAGVSVTLAERWNGTVWAVQSTPNPSGATASFLDAVSCASASACTAIGYYVTSAGTYQMLAEAWNGTAWALQTTPTPSGATASFLLGVSCTAATACTATGYYTTVSTELALAEAWNGTSWAVQSTPAPSGSTASELYGVSCTSASACTAVGNDNTSTGVRTLAERWNGTAWTVQSTSAPSDATASFLNGVFCISASVCTGVGWYETSPGVYETLAENWNGTAWTVQTTPNPSGATANYLFGVSCTSASACTAVGYDLNPSYTALAERWSGTAWAIQSIPTP